MFIPKPKIIVKPIQKQDYFLANGEPIPADMNIRIGLTRKNGYFTVRFRNAIQSNLRFHNRHFKTFAVRRRIYLAFEIRESSRIDGKNKSTSRALGALTFREGDADVPEDFIRKVKDKLERFGIDRNQQTEMLERVRKFISAYMVAFP